MIVYPILFILFCPSNGPYNSPGSSRGVAAMQGEGVTHSLKRRTSNRVGDKAFFRLHIVVRVLAAVSCDSLCLVAW